MQDDSQRVVHVRGGDGVMLALDGPAMRVTQPCRAPAWMPLPRISLLVLEGDISVPTRLLATLVAQGAGIRMIDANGNVIADVVGIAGQRPDCAATLDELVQQADWRKAYARWRMRQSLWDAARTIGRSIALAELARLARPGLMGQSVLALWPAAAMVFKAVAPQVWFDAGQLLARYGWPVERRRASRPGPDVQRDVAQSMRWAALHELRRNPRVAPGSAPAWYSAHRVAILERGRCTFDAFRRWLEDRTRGAA